MLVTYPDCVTMHRGQYAGDSVLVVGRNTEFERLFKRKELREAEVYAKETNTYIENIPSTALCDEAVVAVMAG